MAGRNGARFGSPTAASGRKTSKYLSSSASRLFCGVSRLAISSKDFVMVLVSRLACKARRDAVVSGLLDILVYRYSVDQFA